MTRRLRRHVPRSIPVTAILNTPGADRPATACAPWSSPPDPIAVGSRLVTGAESGRCALCQGHLLVRQRVARIAAGPPAVIGQEAHANCIAAQLCASGARK